MSYAWFGTYSEYLEMYFDSEMGMNQQREYDKDLGGENSDRITLWNWQRRNRMRYLTLSNERISGVAPKYYPMDHLEVGEGSVVNTGRVCRSFSRHESRHKERIHGIQDTQYDPTEFLGYFINYRLSPWLLVLPENA
jgi:hypothetical protein